MGPKSRDAAPAGHTVQARDLLHGSMRPTLLTPDEVAAWLKTTRKAVYAMVERAQLPTVRIGKRVLFREDEMVAWLEKRRAESPGGRR